MTAKRTIIGQAKIALILSFLVPFLLTVADSQERQTVKVGLIYPLTGAMSAFGEDISKALPLLERRFNSAQSKYTFTLIIEDGKFGQGNAAISAAHKLVDIDQVKFLVVGSSGEILQIAPFVEAKKVLAVAGFASHPDVKNAGDYIFRTYVDIDRGMHAVVTDMASKGISRVAVISELSSFTAAALDALKKGLQEKIVFADEYAIGDDDLNAMIAKARASKPQAYYLNATTPASFVKLFRQLRRNGVEEPFYTYYTPSVKEVQNDLQDELNGTLYLDFPKVEDPSEDFTSFLAEFAGLGHAVKSPFNFKTNYNAIRIVYDAIMEVGPDPVKARGFLYSYDRPSATGRLRFDSNGDALELNLELKSFPAEE